MAEKVAEHLAYNQLDKAQMNVGLKEREKQLPEKFLEKFLWTVFLVHKQC